MSNYSDMKKWFRLTEEIRIEEKREPLKNSEKNQKEISKIDKKLLNLKLEKLNNLIKKKYYDQDEEMAIEKMYQLNLVDRGDYYEFSMPLKILFGQKTQDFCSKYWNDFFLSADIDVDFKDNIQNALRQTEGISLTMKINKKITKEVE